MKAEGTVGAPTCFSTTWEDYYTIVKFKRLIWIALKHQKILAVKVQYSHCSKFDDFRPATERFQKNNISSLKHKIELERMCP
jgi:hypothetical protein